MARVNDPQLNWLSINDFTPGIRTKLDYPTTGNVAAPAKLGEAQATNTYRCIALPSGGLAPLPKATQSPNAPTIGVTPAGDGFYHVVGFFAFGPIGPDATPTAFSDCLFIGVEFITSTPNRQFRWFRLALHTTGTPTNTLKSVTSAVATTSQAYSAMTHGVTRMRNPPGSVTSPGTPVVVTSWSPPSFSADRFVWTFPDPDTPGTTGISELTGRSGDLVFHQGRVVLLEYNTYTFGGGGGDATPTNENVSFTAANDLLSTMTAASVAEVFVPEFPHGFGTDGSISAGELFLVKNRGGGVRVSGDIADPIVTRLPGVVSTGGSGTDATTGGAAMGHATSLPSGLFYLSNLGAFLWRGADTATKISEQLEDRFWSNPDMVGMLNKQWQAAEWGDWVLTTNNWLWDTNTGGWWRLENTGTYAVGWCSRSNDANLMWTSSIKYTDAQAGAVLRMWDRRSVASSWSWQSHPIPVSTNRVIDVREVVIRAQGPGTITVGFDGLDDDFGPNDPGPFVVTETNGPQMIRQQCYCKGENVTVRIQSDSGNVNIPAPILYEIRLGYSEQQLGPEQ